MNIKMAGQVIRDSVTMDTVLSLYGYRVKHGFMCCPFHGEKAPSLKVYPKTGGWHCFGCGRGGSVIDFVMEHENCNFPTAVRAIDEALHLGLMDPHEDPMKAGRQRNLQRCLDDFVDAIYAYCDALIAKIEAEQLRATREMMRLEDLRKDDIQQITADEWTRLLAWKDEDQYNNDRKDRIEDFKEEVAAWRRKARRTG